MVRNLLAAAVVLLLCCGCSCLEGLPALNANLAATSVSGLSSGGYFAVQMHVAYSSIMVGAGIFAGGPYNCAQGSSTEALTACMAGTPKPNVATYIDETLARASRGDVDGVEHLAGQQVFLFSGTLDTTVDPSVRRFPHVPHSFAFLRLSLRCPAPLSLPVVCLAPSLGLLWPS